MQLRRYEALMLAVPEITQDETKLLESSIESAVKNAQGSIVTFERWGKYRLAYPVNKNDYGVYFLARFEVPAEGKVHEELNSLFSIKFHELVMRNVVTRLDITDSLDYQRPKSLEESPASRDVDKFLKDNKMTGLLKDRSGKKSFEDYSDEDMADEAEDFDMDSDSE